MVLSSEARIWYISRSELGRHVSTQVMFGFSFQDFNTQFGQRNKLVIGIRAMYFEQTIKYILNVFTFECDTCQIHSQRLLSKEV